MSSRFAAPPRSAQQSGLLWVVAAGFFMQTLDTTIVNTALPAMAASLNADPLAMQPVIPWGLGRYALGLCARKIR